MDDELRPKDAAEEVTLFRAQVPPWSAAVRSTTASWPRGCASSTRSTSTAEAVQLAEADLHSRRGHARVEAAVHERFRSQRQRPHGRAAGSYCCVGCCFRSKTV